MAWVVVMMHALFKVSGVHFHPETESLKETWLPGNLSLSCQQSCAVQETQEWFALKVEAFLQSGLGTRTHLY